MIYQLHPDRRRSDRRQHARIQFDALVRLSDGVVHWNSSLINVSLKGALFTQPEGWTGCPGSHLFAEFVLADNVVIRMQGTVTHMEAGHIGLHCDHIDLDSAGHLKRLMELNFSNAEQPR